MKEYPSNCSRLERIVTPAEDGISVLKALQKWRLSHSLLVNLKKYGCILLNGRPIFVNAKVAAGDTLSVCLDFPEISSIKPEHLPLDIVYEDQDLLLLNKAAGVLVHPIKGEESGTLANGVLQHLISQGLPPCFRPIHRLDRNTSGLILIAKNQYAHGALAPHLKSLVQRQYLAVVEGNITDDAGTISAPIARKTSSIIEREVSPTGQEAITHFWVLERFASATLLKIQLETGRTHQIRVHMAYIGHPLIGDNLYGKASLLIGRQALHSSLISFPHPRSKERLTFSTVIPQDMETLLEKLRHEEKHK